MKELIILLNANLKTPLYEQIYEYIKSDIKDGKISPGGKLPSTRFLSKYLQVSRSTVEMAYEQLVSEGYIEGVAGSGYFVCDIEPLFGKIAKKKEKIVTSVQEMKTYRYNFSPNMVAWPEYSMIAWKKAIKATLQNRMEPLFEAGNSKGEEKLRKVICDYLHQSRGVNCHRNQIIIGAGNEYLLMLLHQVLEGNRCVAMESPTYRQAGQIFANLGWQVSPISMDKYGMTLEGLKKTNAKLAYIMPSHQFPMGNVMPMKRRMELIQWAAEEKGRYIIEDDYDSEFRYKGKPIPSMQGNDPYGCVIYLGTFSKSIAPAIRVSYMVLPEDLVQVYEKRCGFYSSTVSRMQQEILFYFMKEGYFERHLNKMRRIYRSRHDVLLAELKEKSWVKRIHGENAGLHIVVEIRTGKEEKEILTAVKEKGIRAYSLNEYTIGTEAGLPYGEDQERDSSIKLLLGYAGLTEEEIRQGMSLLDEVFVSG